MPTQPSIEAKAMDHRRHRMQGDATKNQRRTALQELGRASVVTLFFLTFGAIVFGIFQAAHSSLFLVQVVEVVDQPQNAPLAAQVISDLADVPVGKKSLFELNLQEIEKKISVNPWIDHVTLLKRFPETLSISVTYRQPVALLQENSGALTYVDSNGRTFGSVNTLARSDLPLFSGFSSADPERIKKALGFLTAWEKSELADISQISSVSWQDEKGYRLWVLHHLHASSDALRGRSEITLGTDISLARDPAQLHRLREVLDYLDRHDIAAGLIHADSGKKIVVRTARSS